jgi:hypothetical protein
VPVVVWLPQAASVNTIATALLTVRRRRLCIVGGFLSSFWA